MTYERAVKIAARSIAMYLLFWAITDVVSVPNEIMSVSHEMKLVSMAKNAGAHDAEVSQLYFLRSSVMYLAANVLRITLWVMAAGWFYRCGPAIQRFFGMEEVAE